MKEKNLKNDKTKQFLKVFNRIYHEWFIVPGYNPPVDNKPFTEEEMEIAAEISNYCEQLFYEITDKQNKKNKDKKSTKPPMADK
jgi:hypothetical protein